MPLLILNSSTLHLTTPELSSNAFTLKLLTPSLIGNSKTSSSSCFEDSQLPSELAIITNI